MKPEDIQEAQIVTSPKPVKAPVELSFPDALREVLNTRKITRTSWNNPNEFGLLQDSYLTIHTKGKYHQWLVNDGDMEANDWVVIEE